MKTITTKFSTKTKSCLQINVNCYKCAGGTNMWSKGNDLNYNTYRKV